MKGALASFPILPRAKAIDDNKDAQNQTQGSPEEVNLTTASRGFNSDDGHIMPTL
jgi:hypothetical protein